MKRDANTGESRRYGFATFEDPSVARALCTGARQIVLDGARLELRPAATHAPVAPER